MMYLSSKRETQMREIGKSARYKISLAAPNPKKQCGLSTYDYLSG
jgi:hypothetical protein